ncbi:hypothetical protein J7905_08220 [Vibrio parahaemolyticus]|nr:hypothetical protein [Vibrio parahaemolyticus]EJG1285961.1 hypothetical protein [Vibrio parahaemolyticus]EJG1299389.1 hypothetical protein [Vibrio parahaemolyticus]EJG1332085.1 hypothetical protein [Vibrio parahaemolyticus]MBM5449283.1 hypothetical protein [Vibrio parahaemolyticus]
MKKGFFGKVFAAIGGALFRDKTPKAESRQPSEPEQKPERKPEPPKTPLKPKIVNGRRQWYTIDSPEVQQMVKLNQQKKRKKGKKK